MVLLKGGEVLLKDKGFVKSDICIEGTAIRSIGRDPEKNFETEVIDVKGLRIIPGLIDIHCHGALGYDVMTASPCEIGEIAGYLARQGTTSFFPTTITSSQDELYSALRNIRKAAQLDGEGALIEGVHIEGPYLNPKQKGCHRADCMRIPQEDEYEGYREVLDPLKVHITLAPELDGSMEFIRCVKRAGGTIGIGHSDAGFDRVKEAVEAGADTFTHLFNGMRGLHHREPGVAGAALASDVPAELICDGIHVHPEVIKLIYRLKGKDGIVLVTDAMQAAGLGDGVYSFGGYKVLVEQGIARKEDGTLASSTLTLLKGLRNMMKFTGISLEEAVPMASINPAKAVGIDHMVGSIEPGKRADLLILDDKMEIAQVILRGRVINPGD